MLENAFLKRIDNIIPSITHIFIEILHHEFRRYDMCNNNPPYLVSIILSQVQYLLNAPVNAYLLTCEDTKKCTNLKQILETHP